MPAGDRTEKRNLDAYDVNRKDGFYETIVLPGATAQTTGNFGPFFIARHPVEVLRVSEVHGTAGSDAGAVTLDIEKLTGTTASGSGTSILSSTFDLKSTANTVVKKQGAGLSSARQLKEGERLGLVDTGALTALDHVVVTVYLKNLGRGDYR